MKNLQGELKDDVNVTILCCGEREYYHLNYVLRNKYKNVNTLLVKQKDSNEDEIESKTDSEEFVQAIDAADMVFVITSLGEENQLKAADFLAQISKEKGILTLGIIIKPSHVDDIEKRKFSDAKIRDIKDKLDNLIIVDRETLSEKISEDMFLEELNIYTNKAITNIIKSLVELISIPGLVNIDIEDVRVIMSGSYLAYMGTGSAEGNNRALKAAEQALSNPLLLEPLNKASGIILNITAGEDIELLEINDIAEAVQRAVCEDVPIIFGAVVDNKLVGEIKVSIIASGYKDKSHLRVVK
jgi:cell division protein FtsZ